MVVLINNDKKKYSLQKGVVLHSGVIFQFEIVEQPKKGKCGGVKCELRELSKSDAIRKVPF